MTVSEREKIKTREFGNPSFFQLKVVELESAAKKLISDRKTKGASMIVHIRASRVRKNVNTTLAFYHVRDIQTGFYYGFPVSVFKDGNIQWRKLVLRENNSFNLNILEDAKLFLVMRMHPEVSGSPLCLDVQGARWEIDDPSITAQKNIVRTQKLVEAFGLAQDLKPYGDERLKLFGRYLGLGEDQLETGEMAFGAILSFSSEQPEAFLDKHKNKDRVYHEAALAAAVSDFLDRDPTDNQYAYQGLKLGTGVADIVDRLKSDSTLNATIVARLVEAGMWPKKGAGVKTNKDDDDI